MLIKTELSGLGNYGVCSILSREVLVKSLQFITGMLCNKDWVNTELDPYKPLGINGSFRILNPDDNKTLKLSWLPGKIKDALLSHGLLMKMALLESPTIEDGFGLEVCPARTEDGWWLKANFTSAVWDIIESPTFHTLLPEINKDIRKWWEDQEGVSKPGQYATIFEGRDGLNLQVYQPGGDGLWIVGCRKSYGTYHFSDHNTDTSQDCFSHVISLCIVLEHCRQVVS